MFCWLLLACLLQQAMCASDGSDVFGAEGKSVTFHLQNVKGENLAWSFGTDTIVTIELGTPIRPRFYDKSYKSRVTFPDDGRALTISQLRRSDAGTYTAKNEEFRANFTLRVYSEVSEPTVNCVRWNCSDVGCHYTLRCAVETPGDKSFFWSHNEQGVDEGPELEVEVLRLEHPDPSLYTCTVQNLVSSSNITVSPAETCRETAARNPAADTSSGSKPGIIVAVVIAVLVVLLIIALVIKVKGRKHCNLPHPAAPSAENYTTVYAEVGAPQKVLVQNSPKAQENDPKKTEASEAETSKTIYATIQAVDQLQTDDEKMGSSRPKCKEEKRFCSPVSELGPAAQPQHGPNMHMDLL